ncbi:MAG: polyprenyl synthetase family protein [Tepidisphaeraceae bacterium]
MLVDQTAQHLAREEDGVNRSGLSAAPPAANAEELLKSSAGHVVEYLKQLPHRYPDAPSKLIEAIQYSLMAGGKRFRPALVLESAKACGVSEPDSSAPPSRHWTSALVAAAAMELIHTFSLVHDDLPAMDNDDLRRGRPTNHKVYGDAIAILAGDAMTTIAFEILATDTQPPGAIDLVRELASASGPQGMIGGQVIDIDPQKRPDNLADLQRLHRMKTGALLKASCRMGAIAAGANPAQISALDAYGRHLGLAFQIVDDILDQTASAEQLGKATGKDAAKGKVTYPMILGLEASRREAHNQYLAALEALKPLNSSTAGLAALAKFVVDRQV